MALLVLPALLLRALVPVGFMPEVDARGGISIALCPGEAALPDTAGISHAPHVHQHGSQPGGHPGAPGATHHAPCLFATSAAPAVMPAMTALTLGVPAVAAVQKSPASEVFPASILRTQSPRGPPPQA